MAGLNFGSGNQTLGGGANQALNDAIARRQTGQASPTQAVSPAAPTFNPQTVAPTLPNPQSTPATTVPGGAPMPSPATDMGASLGMPPQTAAENQLIIKALDAKLRSNATIEKAQGGA